MGIHQIQVRYEASADRLLLSLRSTAGERYAVWLTRRMTRLLLPPFHQNVLRAGLAQATPQALPVPEARQMLEQAALQRALPGADFAQPFDDATGTHPLGTEPLLADAIDMTPGGQGQLTLVLRENRGRRLEMVLTPDLSTALLRLLGSALQAAEWDIPAPGQALPSEGAPPAADTAGRLLN